MLDGAPLPFVCWALSGRNAIYCWLTPVSGLSEQSSPHLPVLCAPFSLLGFASTALQKHGEFSINDVGLDQMHV